MLASFQDEESSVVWLRTTYFLLALVTLVAGARGQVNVLYDALTTEGIKLSDGTVIKLPESSLSDDDCCNVREVLEEVAERVPYEAFIRDSRTARFRVRVKSIKDASGTRTGQTVDVWFIAYGTLKAVEDSGLLEELVKLHQDTVESDEDPNRPLTNEELTVRGIPAAADGQLVERFGYFSGTLIDKVRLSGVTHSILTRGKKSTLSAMVLDERFAGDPDFPNQWRSLKRNEAGEIVIGTPQPYSGLGGYAKATELETPQGALLVEIHVAFDEPHGWFNGPNLLGSKLPLVIQTDVRAFRKKLKNIAKSTD